MAQTKIVNHNIDATGTPSSTTFLRGDNSWNEAGGGAYTVLSTMNCSSTSEATFTSIDTTYDHYYLIGSSINASSAGVELRMRFGTSGGMLTSGYDILRADLSDGNTGYTSSIDYNYNDIYMTKRSVTSSRPLQFECIISRGVNTQGTYPTVKGHTGAMDGSNSNNFQFTDWGASMRTSTTGFDRVSVRMSSGTLESGRITLYGIKHT